jgi:hypothetical protein
MDEGKIACAADECLAAVAGCADPWAKALEYCAALARDPQWTTPEIAVVQLRVRRRLLSPDVTPGDDGPPPE